MSIPVLYYFDGKGRAETIRWMLTACGLEFEEVFLTSKDQYKKMVSDEMLTYEQVPMLEIDGMKLCQTVAILRYIARKGEMYGDTAKEQAMIDMYVEGIQDMFNPTLQIAFQPNDDKKKEVWTNIKGKLFKRYLPVFDKVLRNSKNNHLVCGERQSMADVLLVMALFCFEEMEPDILKNFPTLKTWLEDQKKVDWVARMLAPGSKKKPLADSKYVATVRAVLYS